MSNNLISRLAAAQMTRIGDIKSLLSPHDRQCTTELRSKAQFRFSITRRHSSTMAQGPPPVIVMTGSNVGPDPTTMTCPYCNATITTIVQTGPTTKTHLFCLLLCLLGCWPCAPCVYCADSCQAKKHTCPNCHQFLGVYDG